MNPGNQGVGGMPAAEIKPPTMITNLLQDGMQPEKIIKSIK